MFRIVDRHRESMDHAETADGQPEGVSEGGPRDAEHAVGKAKADKGGEGESGDEAAGRGGWWGV